MAGAAGALGFGGGFAKGLASALQSGRERQDQKAREAQAAKMQELQMLWPQVWKSAEESGNYERAGQFLEQYMPGTLKQFQKKGFSFEALGPLLSAPGLQPPTSVGAGQTPDAAAAVGGTSPTMAMPMPAPPGTPAAAAPPVLPSRAAVAPATPAAPAAAADPQQNFLGFQMLTPEQRDERSVGARRRLAEKMGLPAEEIPYFALGTTRSAMSGSAMGAQSIAGELADGTPAFAVFDRRLQKYLDPDTGQPLEGFRPRPTGGGAGGFGVGYNQAATRMGFATAAQVPPERRGELEQTYQQMLSERAGGTTTARVEAEQQARLLTPDEAAQMQTTYGITRDEAATLGRVPLTPPQIQSAGASFAFDRDVKRARELFEKVWPKDANPELRRGRLMILQRSQNPQFIELLGLLNRMPQRLAVMEQGSRPSDIDVAQFKTTLPTTAAGDWSLVAVPSTYESGLQLLTAAENIAKTSRESIGVIPVEERGQRPAGGAPRTGGAQNAAPAATKDAQGNWIIP